MGHPLAWAPLLVPEGEEETELSISNYEGELMAAMFVAAISRPEESDAE